MTEEQINPDFAPDAATTGGTLATTDATATDAGSTVICAITGRPIFLVAITFADGFTITRAGTAVPIDMADSYIQQAHDLGVTIIKKG